MGLWVGILVKMTAAAWPILGKHGVEATSSRVYARDHGGWSKNEGAQQSWEASFFFDPKGSTTGDGARWPTMLGDELSPEDLERYEAAKAKGDAAPVMGLLHPSSLVDLERLCVFYDCDARKIDGTWRPVKKGLFASLFGRTRP